MSFARTRTVAARVAMPMVLSRNFAFAAGGSGFGGRGRGPAPAADPRQSLWPKTETKPMQKGAMRSKSKPSWRWKSERWKGAFMRLTRPRAAYEFYFSTQKNYTRRNAMHRFVQWKFGLRSNAEAHQLVSHYGARAATKAGYSGNKIDPNWLAYQNRMDVFVSRLRRMRRLTEARRSFLRQKGSAPSNVLVNDSFHHDPAYQLQPTDVLNIRRLRTTNNRVGGDRLAVNKRTFVPYRHLGVHEAWAPFFQRGGTLWKDNMMTLAMPQYTGYLRRAEWRR